MSKRKGTQTEKGRATNKIKPAAAQLKAPAAQDTTGGRRADGIDGPPAAAPTPERTPPFTLELPIVIEHVIGRDPETLPPHRAKGDAAVRGLTICESLFWVVQQLGLMAGEGSWFYDGGDLAEALDCRGAVGKAVAVGASDQAQSLGRIAERLHAGRE